MPALALAPVIGHAQGVLEEIVVTAQKREQSLQDVPISVSAVSGEQIIERSIAELETLGAQLPNVHISEAAIGDKLFIRGIGSGINAGFEQSVGTFIDGVYHGRSLQSRSQFLDIERVEVLRGPQSTFFGNNAIAGALNIVTRRPGQEVSGEVNALYEFEHDEYHFEAAAGMPVTDSLSVRGALLLSGLDGWVDNLNTGATEGEEENKAGRLSLLWEPSDRFDALLKVEFGSFDVSGRNLQNIDCPPATGAGGVCAITTLPVLGAFGPPFNAPLFPGFDDEFNETTQYNGPVPALFTTAINSIGALESGRAVPPPAAFMSAPDRADLLTRNYTLTMNLGVGEHTLTSVTGYSSYEFNFLQQSDFVPVPIATVGQDEEFEQFSQELRLTSPAGGTLEYLAGMYYQSSDLDVKEDVSLYFAPPYFQPAATYFMAMDPMRLPATIADIDAWHVQDEETIAVFGALTWNITDAVRATVGARYSSVDKDLDRRQTITDLAPGITVPCPTPLAGCIPGTPLLITAPNPPLGPAFGWRTGSLDLSREDDDFTPSANLQWDFSERAMLYASFSQGFKAGGYDQRNLFLNPVSGQFEPESVDAWELGLKSVWLDGALQFNLAAFYSEYDDLQVSTFDGVVNFLVNNAASARSQGLELDTRWSVTEHFTLAASLAYLDAEWKDFRNAQCTALSFAAAPNARCTLNAQGLLVQDLTGQDLLMSPQWSGNLFAEYLWPLGGELELLGQFLLYFQDEHNLAADNDPATVQDSYAKIDLRIALRGSAGWELALVGRNLTDELTSGHAEDQPLQSTNSFFRLTERPRSIAIQASYRW